MKVRSATLLSVLSAVAALAAVIAGLLVIGSPSEIRLRRLDERRANELSWISSSITQYRYRHARLPQSLDELQDLGELQGPLKDPVGRHYEYTVKDAASFELCAEFSTATDKDTWFRSSFAKHGRGRQCFSLKTDGVGSMHLT